MYTGILTVYCVAAGQAAVSYTFSDYSPVVHRHSNCVAAGQAAVSYTFIAYSPVVHRQPNCVAFGQAAVSL